MLSNEVLIFVQRKKIYLKNLELTKEINVKKQPHAYFMFNKNFIY